MFYLVSYDDNGNILGFYPKDLLNLYSEVPTQVKEISADEWQLLLDNNGKYKYDIQTDTFVLITQ